MTLCRAAPSSEMKGRKKLLSRKKKVGGCCGGEGSAGTKAEAWMVAAKPPKVGTQNLPENKNHKQRAGNHNKSLFRVKHLVHHKLVPPNWRVGGLIGADMEQVDDGWRMDG